MSAEPGFVVHYSFADASETHSVEGAAEALRILFPDGFPASVLDVGCGIGTWLRAAQDRGAAHILGVDGLDLPSDELLVAKEHIVQADLKGPLRLGRPFDLVLCLETAEHLEPDSAPTLIDSLVAHGDTILFSAAAPKQEGVHHVNCRWPDYWQGLFNERGFACDDAARWLIWDNDRIEPWYRQNLMWARRDPARAGREPRVRPVLHPDLRPSVWSWLPETSSLIEQGVLPSRWYVTAPIKAALAKARRRLRRESG